MASTMQFANAAVVRSHCAAGRASRQGVRTAATFSCNSASPMARSPFAASGIPRRGVLSIARAESGTGFGEGGVDEKGPISAPKPKKKDVDPNRPKNCRTAIEVGQQLFADGKYEEAVDMFLLALELPGQGAVRYPGKPKEYAVPSQGEENAALYNLACSYTAMGEYKRAFQSLEAAFENEFDQFEAAKTDPDLADLRKQKEFDGLIFKYDGLFAKAFKSKKPKNYNKPWLSW